MLRADPGHPFVLIHMAQLGPDEVARLIATHPNLYFIPAHATPVSLDRTREPWTAMFTGTGGDDPRRIAIRPPHRRDAYLES